MMSFKNKVVLVTGSAQGIGRTIAIAYARQGAELVLTDINELQLEQTREEIAAMGNRVHAWPADVRDPDAIGYLRQKINEVTGGLDVLVNNAGVVFGGAFLDVPLEKHRLTFDINVMGLCNVTWTFMPDLIKRPQSRIVNIASASGIFGLPFGATYSASKWAVLGFSESLRMELEEQGHEGLKVTAICPSYINTGMFDGVSTPRLTRMLDPEELAGKIVRASARGQAVLLEPTMVKLTPYLKLLPQPVVDLLSRVFGIRTSMQQWQGKHHEGG